MPALPLRQGPHLNTLAIYHDFTCFQTKAFLESEITFS